MSISWSDIESFAPVTREVDVFGRRVQVAPLSLAVAGWISRAVPKPVAPKKAVLGKAVEDENDPAYTRTALPEYNRRVTVVSCAVALGLLEAGGITVSPGNAAVTDSDRAWVEAVYARLAPRLTDNAVVAILKAANEMDDKEGAAISK